MFNVTKSNKCLTKSEIDKLLNQKVDDELVGNYERYIGEINSTPSIYYNYHFGLLNDKCKEFDFGDIDNTRKGIGDFSNARLELNVEPSTAKKKLDIHSIHF